MKRPTYNDLDLRCAQCGDYWNDCNCDRLPHLLSIWGFLLALITAGLVWWLSR